MGTVHEELDELLRAADRIRQFKPHPEAAAPERPKAGKARTGKAKENEGMGGKTGVDQKEPGGTPAVVVQASPQERLAAQSLLGQIGQRFAKNRKESKSKAFESYQQDLANNQGILVMGGAVTLKELTVLLMDLEAYMKSNVREGETAATRLQKYLAGELANEVE